MSWLFFFFVFLVLCGLFGFGIWWNFSYDQIVIFLLLINKLVLNFVLFELYDLLCIVIKVDLLGKFYLFNVFVSWCIECGVEYLLLQVEVFMFGVILVGYNYKDQLQDVKVWLEKYGNFYVVLMVDLFGQIVIDFGVYVVLESFLIDVKGVICYKCIGLFMFEVIEKEFKLVIVVLKKEVL